LNDETHRERQIQKVYGSLIAPQKPSFWKRTYNSFSIGYHGLA